MNTIKIKFAFVMKKKLLILIAVIILIGFGPNVSFQQVNDDYDNNNM